MHYNLQLNVMNTRLVHAFHEEKNTQYNCPSKERSSWKSYRKLGYGEGMKKCEKVVSNSFNQIMHMLQKRA